MDGVSLNLVVGSSILIGTLVYIFKDKSKNINGYRYRKYINTSSVNPSRVVDGNLWTSAKRIKKRLKKRSEKDFFIGNFRYTPQVLLRCDIPSFYRKKNEKVEIYITQTDLKKTTIVWGGMGGGKTIFFLNLLEQSDKYNNALVHDGGKLEMVSKLYNPMRDIIFNPYDDRATIHNLLSEDTSIQAHFFQLLLKSKSGENVNFFSSGAAEHLENISLLTNSKNFKSIKKKWSFFMDSVDELIKNVMNGEHKSEKDVISTLKQILAPLQLMNYRIQDGANTFVIDDFLDKKNGAKLFVSYPPQLRPKVQNISSAFIALFTMVHLSRPDTKDRFHLYMIDELSSYLRMLNDVSTLKDQLELLRSKGGMFVGGLQGDDEDQKYNEILDKTVSQKFYFRTDGLKTKESLIKKMGKVRYVYSNLTRSANLNKSKSYTLNNAEADVISNDDFQDLGTKFEYIAIIKDILYRGYTPLTVGEINNTIRATPFIEYKNRQEFENHIAEKYEKTQAEKFQKSEKKSAEKKIATDLIH